jgi:hypothetical protein
MRAKLVSIAAILWVAAVGAITIAFVANRPTHNRFRCDPGMTYDECSATIKDTYRVFEWGDWLAWTGVVTLVAVAAVAVVVIATHQTKVQADG